MPRFDGTGPNGKGPGTGRGLGNCSKNENVKTDNNEMPRENKQFPNRRGLGRGKRRGMQ